MSMARVISSNSFFACPGLFAALYSGGGDDDDDDDDDVDDE